MSIKVPFTVRYGQNVLDIPINGGKAYADAAPNGLSDLSGNTFTLINQVPQSAGDPSVRIWVKRRIKGCQKRDGLYAGANDHTVFDKSAFTVFCNSWQSYRPPLFTDGGFYALSDTAKEPFFTVNPRDFIIFADVADNAPQSNAEFAALKKKYAGMGGVITGAEVYVQYKPNGTPWRTNHIEMTGGKA